MEPRHRPDALAGAFYDRLTTPDGVAYAGLDLAAAAPIVTFTLVPWSTAGAGKLFRNGGWVAP